LSITGDWAGLDPRRLGGNRHSVVPADLQGAPLVAEDAFVPVDPLDFVVFVDHRVGAHHVEIQVVGQVISVLAGGERAGHAGVDPQLGHGDPVGQPMFQYRDDSFTPGHLQVLATQECGLPSSIARTAATIFGVVSPN
jgi:hypothetical protein